VGRGEQVDSGEIKVLTEANGLASCAALRSATSYGP
jgi:hypothetical protein